MSFNIQDLSVEDLEKFRPARCPKCGGSISESIKKPEKTSAHTGFKIWTCINCGFNAYATEKKCEDCCQEIVTLEPNEDDPEKEFCLGCHGKWSSEHVRNRCFEKLERLKNLLIQAAKLKKLEKPKKRSLAQRFNHLLGFSSVPKDEKPKERLTRQCPKCKNLLFASIDKPTKTDGIYRTLWVCRSNTCIWKGIETEIECGRCHHNLAFADNTLCCVYCEHFLITADELEKAKQLYGEEK